jgi:hypothetical protein
MSEGAERTQKSEITPGIERVRNKQDVHGV